VPPSRKSDSEPLSDPLEKLTPMAYDALACPETPVATTV
jgi:hypothetical protein